MPEDKRGLLVEAWEDDTIEAKAERLELVLEGTRLGLWDWNPQTNQVHFDKRWAEMIGYEYDEIEHHLDTWSSKVHPDDIDQCFMDIQAHMDGDVDFYENIHRMKHKNGNWVYILDRGKIVKRDEEGRPIRFTGTHTDITKEKEAELAAKAALRSRAQFLANMSHEIRTPLQGIIGNVQILKENYSDEALTSRLSMIESSGRLLLGIVNDILDYSKLETKGISLNATPFSLKESVHSVLSVIQPKADKSKTVLEFKNETDVDWVLADCDRFKQIMYNLVGNAVKFCLDGLVTVTVQQADAHEPTDEQQEWLRFTVKDTGIGIPEEQLAKVFRPFEQVDSSKTRTVGGTGLGLAIVREIVQAWGGKIEVRSELGCWTEFSIILPMALSETPGAVAIEEVELRQLPRMRILLVEDNLINQSIFANYLESLHQDYAIANDGAEAVAKVKKNEYDCILMDCHMPNMDGYKATKHIKGMLKEKAPPVIALTASAMKEDKALCEEAGMDEFLSKPLTRLELFEVLQRVVKKQNYS